MSDERRFDCRFQVLSASVRTRGTDMKLWTLIAVSVLVAAVSCHFRLTIPFRVELIVRKSIWNSIFKARPLRRIELVTRNLREFLI